VTAAYRNDRPQILAILKSAGLPPPVVQNPAGIRLGTLNYGGGGGGQGNGRQPRLAGR
jgi:hypothetical protein